MEDFSRDLAMILPKSLCKKAQTTLRDNNIHIPIHEASLDNALKIAKELERQEYLVVIVRGGTEYLLEDAHLSMSIVSIPVTPLDVSRAMDEARLTSDKIGIIAFPNMIPAIEAYEQIVGVTVYKHIVDSEAEVELALRRMITDGIEVVVGGGIINQFSESLSAKTVVFDSDTEAIISAVFEAKRLLRSITHEKEEAQRFKTIVESIRSGVISVDQSGDVQTFNASAERLLGIDRKDALGKRLGELFPWLSLADTLSYQHEELDQIHNHRGKSVIYSKFPVLVSGSSRGAIAVLEDVETIRRMEEKNRQEYRKKGHFAKHNFSEIITCSEDIRETIAIAKEYALSDSTIFIEGETGTGKEIFAQSIHNYSSRAAGPFVAVNCAALPETLLDSELFGYVAGAFTGADRKGKVGLFEMAHQGTIFLDEISEMDLAVQGRLLRVLQEKNIMRIGDNKLLPINVRVIAASNRDIRKEVQAGKFRVDLFYRLNVLNLHLEPIRHRKEDIPLLINHFINELSDDFHKEFSGFTPEEKKLLSQHRWSGNTREIKNFAERFVLFKRSKMSSNYQLSHLLEGSWSSKDEYQPGDMIDSTKDRDYILDVLAEHDGNMSQSAKTLGISRTTLWRRMKELDIRL